MLHLVPHFKSFSRSKSLSESILDWAADHGLHGTPFTAKASADDFLVNSTLRLRARLPYGCPWSLSSPRARLS